MVKVYALIPKRPDITDEFFHQHWISPHGEMACGMAPLQGYIQAHRIAPGVAGLTDSIYEGIATVWFVDEAAAGSMGEDPTYANHVGPDEKNFIDLERLAFLFTNEHVQREEHAITKDEPGTKVMLLLRRAAGLAPADFAAQVAGVDLAGAVPGAHRVSVAVATASMYADGAEPVFDAIVELEFSTAADCDSAWSGAGSTVLGALDGAIDASASAGFLSDELRLLWPVKS
ncbi:unannotated protein [freshwater metagenome]|uniref:Unannotated protein n=1 Tax=freshwater metagenome TaxID=449393 RepID=A0A6J7CNU6_9ZZZZ